MSYSPEQSTHPEEAPNRTPAEVEHSMQDLRAVLDGQIEKPPRGDAYIRAYALAMRSALDYSSPINDFVRQTLEARPLLGGSYLVNKIRSALQYHLYNPDAGPDGDEAHAHHRIMLHNNGKPLHYPQDFVTPDMWTIAFEAVLEDVDASSEFLINVWTRRLVSNKSDRYKSVKLFALGAQDLGRLDDDITIADIGCSQQAGGNHLLSGLPFDPVTVIRHGSRTGTPSIQQTAAVNRNMNRPLTVNRVTGFDLEHPRATRWWAWACSHYPSELLDADRVKLYERLITEPRDNISFYRSDFTEFNYEKFLQEIQAARAQTALNEDVEAAIFPGAREAYRELNRDRQLLLPKYKIVSLVTMLYQATPEEREAILANARKLGEEFILVQDFASINRERPSELLFRDNWQDDPFPYRTFVLDLRDEKPIWHEMFRWRDGRCREMVMGMGRIATANGQRKSLWTPLVERHTTG